MTVSSKGGSRPKIKGAPDYDDPGYWDEKFAMGKDVGEWLESGDVLLDEALFDLENRSYFAGGANPRVLHLGPGISKLGTKLCEEFMSRRWLGKDIVNVDFSAEAVRLGLERENGKDQDHTMPWQCADLRSWKDVSKLSSFAPFDVILDKGTSDALATAEPQRFSPSSDLSSLCPTVSETVQSRGEETTLSALELLALHLVPMTQKDATWIALSYSASRFADVPCLEDYWTLVSRTSREASPGQASAHAYTPKVYHWLYVLRRK